MSSSCVPNPKPLPWILAFLLAVATCAQTSRGVIVGKITDQSGAVVPSAQVVLVNQKTGIAAEVKASAEGDYTFTNLEPGRYRLTVTSSGFRTSEVQDLTLYVDQTVRADWTLEPGDVATKVDVQAAAPVVDSETSSVGSIVDGNQVLAMPINGRQGFHGLLALAAGVTINPVTEPTMIAGGTHIGSYRVTVDGVTNVDGIARLNDSTVSVEAISEFRVIDNAAPAEFGQGGAQVEVATKSRTNEFHGSLLYFNGNRGLAANSFFSNRAWRPKPKFNRNEFAGSLEGPIIRNKTFFFGNFEGLIFPRTETHVVAMPTAALSSGDFGGLPAIKDPTTGQPFPGNRIPAEGISAISKELLKFTSAPNTPTSAPGGLGNSFTVNVPGRERNNRYTGRLDHQFGAKDRLTGRFYLVYAGPNTLPAGGAGGGTDKFGNWGGRGDHFRNFMGSWKRLVSPRTVNELRFGTHLQKSFRTPQNADFDPSRLIPGLPAPVRGAGGLPTLRITGFRGFDDVSGAAPGGWDTYEVTETFAWSQGRHNWKAGFQYAHSTQSSTANTAPARGLFVFSGRYAGQAFADFLLGTLSSSGRANRNQSIKYQGGRYHAFVQDDWNVSRR